MVSTSCPCELTGKHANHLAPVTEDEEEERDTAYEREASLENLARQHTMEMLERHGGHRERTAKALGISLPTLKRRLRKWGLTVPRGETPVPAAPGA